MTYEEFIDHIRELVIRDDAPIVTFIRRAESALRPVVRHYLSEKVVTLPVVDGIASLPADFLELRTLSGCKTYKPVSPAKAVLAADEVGYYRVANDLSFLGDAGDEVELLYFAAFPDLTEDQSNWLFDRFPGVYLAAVLKAHAQWEKDAEGVAIETAALNEALAVMAEDDRRGRQTGPLIIGGGSW